MPTSRSPRIVAAPVDVTFWIDSVKSLPSSMMAFVSSVPAPVSRAALPISVRVSSRVRLALPPCVVSVPARSVSVPSLIVPAPLTVRPPSKAPPASKMRSAVPAVPSVFEKEPAPDTSGATSKSTTKELAFAITLPAVRTPWKLIVPVVSVSWTAPSTLAI